MRGQAGRPWAAHATGPGLSPVATIPTSARTVEGGLLCFRQEQGEIVLEFIGQRNLPAHSRWRQFDNPRSEMKMKQKTVESRPPLIGLIMGSESDWKTMGGVAETLKSLDIKYEKQVVSAHRTPVAMFEYANTAESRGLTLIIAGAGGAAHLPGMVASRTIVPVIGVPVNATPLNGLDALLSIMQMPAEVGVATVRVAPEGAVHAALFAATVLSREDDKLYERVRAARGDMAREAKSAKPAGIPGTGPQVAILVEREQDFELMQHAENHFTDLGISFSKRVLDPSTSPDELLRYTRTAEEEGTAVFIAGSGQGIGLACKVARTTMLPVLGVPIVSGPIECLDRYLQPFLEMPSGVATFAIGRAGAVNAALFAATILSLPGSDVRSRLQQKRDEQVKRVEAMKI